MDAVGGRTVDEIPAFTDRMHAQRRMQGQGIAGATLVPVRRDHRDLGDIGKRIGERVDTCRQVAIIVTDKDFHRICIGCSVQGALTILNVSPPP